MALGACRQCGETVSDTATACPHCRIGTPVARDAPKAASQGQPAEHQITNGGGLAIMLGFAVTILLISAVVVVVLLNGAPANVQIFPVERRAEYAVDAPPADAIASAPEITGEPEAMLSAGAPPHGSPVTALYLVACEQRTRAINTRAARRRLDGQFALDFQPPAGWCGCTGRVLQESFGTTTLREIAEWFRATALGGGERSAEDEYFAQLLTADRTRIESAYDFAARQCSERQHVDQ